ncbi:HupE/UreJ family protein [Pelomonas sp. APW6]|uniref:HupE/UreJ family protein n=1 Tax=Roseateles subflavus TaxID=3053353 RepID=A0ABT7LCY9_9BURK|nr:HupE/UreJ family protein [Pelomonas sp. APW6]MDL5030309.1 HupE/UreJ family protein [Pelomonas sp. APW6]
MTHRLRPFLIRSAVALTAALPLLVQAHGTDAAHAHGGMQSLVAGIVHPFTGADHLLAMFSVGLWSGLCLARRWLAPLVFVALLVLGALTASSSSLLLGLQEPLIAASVLALGLLVALRWSWPPAAVAALVGLFAWSHGLAHGQELGGAPLALLGMAAGTALLHGAGLILGAWLRARHRWAPRVLGGSIALTGLALTVGTLA